MLIRIITGFTMGVSSIVEIKFIQMSREKSEDTINKNERNKRLRMSNPS